MKKFFSRILYLSILCFCNSIINAKSIEDVATEIKKAKIKKPKIIILSSQCGNGHGSACSVLKEILPDCEIKLIYPINDFFRNNPIYSEKRQEDLVKNGWIKTVNFMTRYPGEVFLKLIHKRFQKYFCKLLEKEKPNLLISVIPTINYPASCAAINSKIPFIIITLDADLELWLLNMEKCKKHDFIITVPIKTPHVEKQLSDKHIPTKCIHEVGCPLRKDFFTPKNIETIRKEWNIPYNKKVILLMRGGTGSNVMANYVRELVKLNISTHILIYIGRNTKLISKLNKIKTSKFITFSIVQFTPKIPELMAISDVLITQPSPNACNEAMHMHLPILVDMTSPCLFWEKATLDWITIRGCGESFKHMRQLNNLVLEYFEKKKIYRTQESNSARNFNTEMHSIVTKLLEI